MHHAVRRNSLRGLATACLAATIGMFAAPVHAANPFDGYWSVSIKTLSGSCDPTYNFNVQIADGHLNGANGALLGLVSANGAVNVQMGGGERRGIASGRLKGNSGSGRWSGSATGASCRGLWTANRG